MPPSRNRKIVEFPIVNPEERLTNPDARIDHKRLQNIRNYNLTNETRTAKAIVAPPGMAGAGDFSDIQTAIDFVHADGGGIVFLRNGTYLPTEDIEIPSDITIQGETADGAIVDFGGAALQIKAEAATIYSTGTVAATNRSVTVTGSGTTWTSALIGSSILLQGVWYVITAVGSTTSLTIDAPYESLAVTGATYVIADPVGNISLSTFTIQGSTDSLGALSFKNLNGLSTNDITIFDSTIGLNYVNTSDVTVLAFFVVGCGTGVNISHGGIWSFDNWAILSSTTTNIVIDRLISASIKNFTCNSSAGNAFTVTNTLHISIYDGLIASNGWKGIEISDSNDIEMSALTIHSNGSDGIKLTSNADRCSMYGGILFRNNGGYGLNIANANCDNNTVTSCSFTGNTSGTVNNSGTSTINANNQT